MEVSAINAELTEGSAPETGFAAAKAEDQKAEFCRWLDKVRPSGDKGIDAEENRSERDWYWQHFTTGRILGLTVKEIAPPDPFAGFARNGKGNDRETILLPYFGGIAGARG